MWPGLPRPAQTGLAAGLALSFVALASSPALADHARSQEWWLGTLHVTQAWQSTQGGEITVALLDTGVDPTQPDLTGSVISGPDFTKSGRKLGGPFWGAHGTAMASLIAGHGHGQGSSEGIMGVAPKAKILSVRVTLEGNDPDLGNPAIAGGLPKAIARGIKYAVRKGATVIDLPLDPSALGKKPTPGGSSAERSAVNFALDHHVVLVAPAGDGGTGTDPLNYPAAYPGVISVGAFNEAFAKAPYSSHRGFVTLTAAGDGVTAANGPKGYAPVHSTSAASAVVAGIVALVKSQFPALTPAQVRHVLITSTAFQPKGGRGNGSGYGTVDAAAALVAASRLVNAVPSASASSPAQAPPKPPVVHSKVVRKNLGHSLMTDAGIAVAIFLVLLAGIFGATTLRRRRARSARLADVRAAAMVPVRKPGPAAGAAGASGAPGPNGAAAGNGSGPGADGQARAWGSSTPVTTNAAWTPNPGSGLLGSFPAGGPAAEAGLPGTPGRAAPQVESAGFIPAPPLAGSPSPSFNGGGPLTSSLPPAAGGMGSPVPADPAGPVSAADDIAPVAAGAPPWAPVPDPTTPSTRTRGGSQPAIPDSAFPSGAAGAGDADGRSGGRRAQGSHRAPARAPQVSGTPPWAPAARPDSELPWAQAPAPPPPELPQLQPPPPPELPQLQPPRPDLPQVQSARPDLPQVQSARPDLPQVQSARPDLPAWESIAEEAWPGGPRGAIPHLPGTGAADQTQAPPSASTASGLPTRAPRAASPSGDAQAGERSIYVASPDAARDPGQSARPEHGSGFLRGGRRQPAAPQPPAIQAPSAGPGAAADNSHKINIPPWEITDSFLAIRTDPVGAAGSERAAPGPATGPGQDTSLPASPAGRTPAFPSDEASFPPPAAAFGAASPDSRPEPPSLPRGGSFPGTAPQFPGSPAEFPGTAPQFPGSAAEYPSSAAEYPSSAAEYPSSAAGESGFGRGTSSPGTPAEPPAFGRGGSLFGKPAGDAPGRTGASFPSGPPAEAPGFGRGRSFPDTPSFPRPGTSFPGTGQPGSGQPGTGQPGSGPAGGDATENIPALPSTASGLPRRTPLSERTGDAQPSQPRDNSTAFRLFPPAPGESTESLPAVPPKDSDDG